MGLQCTAAIILNHRDFGESDKIVTFFTSNLGKVKGIAKGAKRSRKRFANQLELFSLVQPILSGKNSSSLSRIEECDLIEPFASIREMPIKYAHAAYFSELVDLFVHEHDPSPELFKLLVWVFRNMEQGDPLDRLSIIFQLRLLRLIGYAPGVTACAVCNEWKEGPFHYMFDYEKGGIICPACLSIRGGNRVAPGTVKLLALAQKLPLGKVSRLCFSTRALSEINPILEEFSQRLIGKEIKSFPFLIQARKMFQEN